MVLVLSRDIYYGQGGGVAAWEKEDLGEKLKGER